MAFAQDALASLFNFGEQTSESEKETIIKAYRDLSELLLSAGYFRARNASLAPFDKVVGGMCWCIASSGKAVDVDLFYRENLKIGQRIKLCENIVRVCRALKCPFPLQAHQIQGNDMKAIYPVVQFLVKKVFEYRGIACPILRRYSEMQFDSKYVLPYAKATTFAHGSREFYALLQHQYKPKRSYRRSTKDVARARKNEVSHVYSCLLEYGEKLGSMQHVDSDSDSDSDGEGKSRRRIIKGEKRSGFEEQYAEAQIAMREESAAQLRSLGEEEARTLQKMASVAGVVSSVGGAQVAGFVGMQSDAIAAAAAGYAEEAEKRRAEGDGTHLTKRGLKAAHRRQVQALQRQLDTSRGAHDNARAVQRKEEEVLVQAHMEESKVLARNKRIEAESARLTGVEQRSENRDKVGRLRSLVQLNVSE